MSNLIHLNGLIGDIFNTLFGWIIDLINTFVAGILNVLLSYIYTVVFGAFCAIVDACQYLFRIFAGTADAIYTEAGQNIFGTTNIFGASTGNMLFDFLMSSTVIDIFIKLIVLSLFLIIIFTIVAIVKQEYATEVTKPDNNKMSIIAKSGRAFMSIIFIPIMCIFGIYASNLVLQAIDGATSNGGTSLGARIFVASSFNANRARIDEQFYLALCGRASDYTLSNTFNGYFADGATNTDKGMDIVATNVDEAFLANESFPNALGTNKPMEWVYGDTFGNAIKYTFWWTPVTASNTFSCTNFVVAHYYYDLWQFDYVVAAVTGIFMAFMFLKLLITLAKRIYEIILLFLASPVVASMMPLDGGNALKDWRKQFIGKIFMIYGPVVAMNLFISIFGLFTSVDSLSTIVNVLLTSFGTDAETILFAGPATLPFLDASFIYKHIPGLYQAYQLILCIFMCAGVMVVDQTSKWVSAWIGAEDALAAAKGNNETFKGQMTSANAKAQYALSKTAGVAGGAFRGAGKVGKAITKLPAAGLAAGKAVAGYYDKKMGGYKMLGARGDLLVERDKDLEDLKNLKKSGGIDKSEYKELRKATKQWYKEDKLDLDNMKSEFDSLMDSGMDSHAASEQIRKKYNINDNTARGKFVKGLEQSGKGREHLSDIPDLMTLGVVGYNKAKKQTNQYKNRFGSAYNSFTNGNSKSSQQNGSNVQNYAPLTAKQQAEQKRMDAQAKRNKKIQEKKEYEAKLKQTWREADKKVSELRYGK